VANLVRFPSGSVYSPPFFVFPILGRIFSPLLGYFSETIVSGRLISSAFVFFASLCCLFLIVFFFYGVPIFAAAALTISSHIAFSVRWQFSLPQPLLKFGILFPLLLVFLS